MTPPPHASERESSCQKWRTFVLALLAVSVPMLLVGVLRFGADGARVVVGLLAGTLLVCLISEVGSKWIASTDQGPLRIMAAQALRLFSGMTMLMTAKLLWPDMPSEYALYAMAFYAAVLAAEVIAAIRHKDGDIVEQPIPSSTSIG